MYCLHRSKSASLSLKSDDDDCGERGAVAVAVRPSATKVGARGTLVEYTDAGAEVESADGACSTVEKSKTLLASNETGEKRGAAGGNAVESRAEPAGGAQ
jgi:hypothetical protein